MSQLTLTLNQRSYTVQCEPGEESRVQEVATIIEEKMTRLAQFSGAISETQLLLYTALMLGDEILDWRKQPREGPLPQSPAGDTAFSSADLLKLNSRLNNLVARLNNA